MTPEYFLFFTGGLAVAGWLMGLWVWALYLRLGIAERQIKMLTELRDSITKDGVALKDGE